MRPHAKSLVRVVAALILGALVALTLPNSAEAHTGLGLAYTLQGKVDEAIDQFQLALRLDPQSADARRQLAIALRQRRR